MVDVLKHRALGRAEMVRAIDVLHNVLILLFDLIEKQSDILQFPPSITLEISACTSTVLSAVCVILLKDS